MAAVAGDDKPFERRPGGGILPCRAAHRRPFVLRTPVFALGRPGAVVDDLRAAHSGVRAWDGPARVVDDLRARTPVFALGTARRAHAPSRSTFAAQTQSLSVTPPASWVEDDAAAIVADREIGVVILSLCDVGDRI